MLGIIFTGGEGPPVLAVKRLLETEVKDALFVAADSGLAAAESAGLKPHWIIGDMDSLGDLSRLCAYSQERIIRLQHEKDYTDTEVAISHVVEQGCDCFWIIGGGGGRIDHLFAIRSLFEREIFPCRWITNNADIRCIDADNSERGRLFCSLDRGAAVSVFPLGNGPWEAESSGLKWPLAGLPWDRGFYGLSNVAVDGEFSIKAESGRFMVILPHLLY